MFQLIGANAEFERALIQERVRAGLRNARNKGETTSCIGFDLRGLRPPANKGIGVTADRDRVGGLPRGGIPHYGTLPDDEDRPELLLASRGPGGEGELEGVL